MMTQRDYIEAALLAAFSPVYIDVLDESFLHHMGKDSHYRVVVVSAVFDQLSAVKRHQLVYTCLGELMGLLHALALHTYTPEEWLNVGMERVASSPVCDE